MAETKTIKQLKKELITAIKAVLKEEHDARALREDIDKAIKIARALREELIKLKQNENPVVLQSGKTLSVEKIKDGDERVPKKRSKDKLIDLLKRLPGSCANEDTTVMKEILKLIIRSTAARTLFGENIWAIIQLLNATSIDRSYSDASLQIELVSIVSLISHRNDSTRGNIVNECSVDAMPFLLACLKSQVEIRREAALAISELATLKSNREKIGKSGVMKLLVELIQEKGDWETVTHAGRAIRFLCRGVVENRREAVSEGAVIAVIDKMRSGILVEEMSETLVVLSEDEGAIAELENARQTLQNVANSGTSNAKKKLAHLLFRLKYLAADIHSK